jgi:hypothetical protein
MTSFANWIRTVAAHFCDAKTLERLVNPILSDIDVERREAVTSGRPWFARWILLNGYIGFYEALALHGVRVCGRAISSDEAATRTIAFTIAAFVVLTVALVLPPLLDAHAPSLNGMLAVYLLPQAIPSSIPVALSFGIACGWSRDGAAGTMLRRVLVHGIAGSLAALATMEWLVPAANQAFREAVIDQVGTANVHMPRGVRGARCVRGDGSSVCLRVLRPIGSGTRAPASGIGVAAKRCIAMSCLLFSAGSTFPRAGPPLGSADL